MTQIAVKTNLGVLTAEPSKDNAFKGIEIRLDNEIVAIIEENENRIRTIAYNDKDDEPIDIIDFNTENNDLSQDESDQLNIFFTNGNFITSQDKVKESAPFKYMWDDFDLLKSYLAKNKNKKFFFYTLVECDNGEAWIIEGKRIVNRIGYFISTTPINITEEGIRYW